MTRVAVFFGVLAVVTLFTTEFPVPLKPKRAALAGPATVQAAEPEKSKADPVAGKWEAQSKAKTSTDLLTHTLTFADGKMEYIEPRNPFSTQEHRPVKIDAEYTVSKTGRVYGFVTRASGGTTLDEGDTFSFIPKIKDGQMILEQPKGAVTEQLALSKDGWKRKP